MAKSFNQLRKQMTAEQISESETKAEKILASMALQEIRQVRELTQQELADILHVKQAALSKIEKQKDIRLSTLYKILSGMGGKLKLIAEFPEGEILINQFEVTR